MSGRRPVLQIPDGAAPKYLRIAAAVIEDIQRGRLHPGAELPGTRALADEIGVHRNTVKAAYAELGAQGWVSTRASAATFVALDLPERSRRRTPRPGAGTRLGFPLPPMDVPPADTWDHLDRARVVFAGVDPRLFPAAALGRAYRRALASRSDVLGYRLGRGHPRFVAALRQMLVASRGISPEQPLLVTRGSQMGLDLVVRALVRPGDAVAIEDPGYAFSWPTFRLAGAELVPIPVDRQGLDVGRLAEVCERRTIRAILVTPNAHYPTGVPLSAARRIALLELAQRHRAIVIEDDWVHEVRFEGRPLLPLAHADRAGTVIYLGSFSKTFAPALRLGFVLGPEAVIERLARLRARIDVCGDSALEVAVAELLEDGEVQRHVRRLTRILRTRRDALVHELERSLGSVLRFTRPSAGSALWAEVDPAVDVERWAERSLDRGIGFLTGRHFFLDERPHPNVWLAFAALDESAIANAVSTIVRALPSRASRA